MDQQLAVGSICSKLWVILRLVVLLEIQLAESRKVRVKNQAKNFSSLLVVAQGANR